MDLLEIYNDDCFNVFSKMKDNSIDLFVLDLPYANKKFGNCTSCKWDTPVDLGKMWVEIKRIMKPKAVLCFFCNTKFGFTLIESNPKWFRYDLVWKKSRKVGFLSANKRQLRNHENIYIFGDKAGSYNPQKVAGEPYNRPSRTNADLYSDTIKNIPTINTGDRHPCSVIEHENVYVFGDKTGTYNPQKTEGTPYKCKEHNDAGYYRKDSNYKRTANDNKGVRHPCSVIEHENVYVFGDKAGTYNPQKVDGEPYDRMSKGTNVDCFNGTVYDTKTKFKPVKNDGYRHPCSVIEHENTTHENTVLEYKSVYKTIHKTEKPVGLLEYLIKSYSNEGDTVMDFTMGSASCGEACFNTKRKFIGVERDDDIFLLAQERLSNLEE